MSETKTTLIREIKSNWKPSLQGAHIHVKLVIKEYSQLDTIVFHKQLDTTLRGLITAGFDSIVAKQVIMSCIIEGGFNPYEWINGRTTKEIVTNK